MEEGKYCTHVQRRPKGQLEEVQTCEPHSDPQENHGFSWRMLLDA